MKKTGVILIFLVCLLGTEMAKSDGIQKNLSENLIRLHIIANSNSENDQNIKLAVRDAVIELGSLEIGQILKTANEELLKNDAGYGAKVSYRKRYVPQKTYKNIALPEGIYTCIDIILGKGGGENWWCVAYPPLCFTEAVSGEMSDDAKKQLKKRLSQESLSTILKDENISYRFKIVEDFQKVMKFLE